MMFAPLPVLAQAGLEDVWDWAIFWDFVPQVAEGLLVTLQATGLGISIAVVLGLALALLRRAPSRIVATASRWFVEFIRSTPLLVQLFFIFIVAPDFGLRLGPFSSLVAGLAIHYGAYTSEAYRAGIESVGRGQWEAAVTLNLPRTTTWTRVVLPQAVPTVLPALGNYLVAMLKDAPLGVSIGVIGVLGTASRLAATVFRPTEAYTAVGLLFLVASVPLAYGVRYLEKRYGYQRT